MISLYSYRKFHPKANESECQQLFMSNAGARYSVRISISYT